MKINWRKVWKVLRVIGEIVLAVYGVVMTILYAIEEREYWKEFRLNYAARNCLGPIRWEINSITTDSQFRKFVNAKIEKYDRDCERIREDKDAFYAED